MRVNLTPAFVAKKAEPPVTGDRTIYWDTGLPGFGLVVTQSGHCSYCVQYRSGRRSRRMALKNGLSLAAAQTRSKGHHRNRRQGWRSAGRQAQGG